MIQLGARLVRKTEKKRGFIARVDRSGHFRIIHLAETGMLPSALTVDRGGKLVVSYEDGQLAGLTPQGATLWSRELPPARALGFAPDGDILAAGCSWFRSQQPSTYVKRFYTHTEIKQGYVARLTPQGQLRWKYRLGSATATLFEGQNARRVVGCATGIAPAPGDDAYVAGFYSRSIAPEADDESNAPPQGSFVARFSAAGEIRWSRLVATSGGRVSLAAAPDGALVVVAARVVSQPNSGYPRRGLAAFDANGTPVWSLPMREVEPGFVRESFTEVDRQGTVVSLRSLRGRQRPTGYDNQATSLILAPGASVLWVGGAMGPLSRGAWVQVVPW